jgi:hypothetical protein
MVIPISVAREFSNMAAEKIQDFTVPTGRTKLKVGLAKCRSIR